MKDLILRLASIWGPAGREEEVRAAIAREVSPWACPAASDALGNLLVQLAPGDSPGAGGAGSTSGRSGMILAAGMDSPGGIVTEITEKGLLRFATVGDWPAATLAGQTVRFRSGVLGVIGAHSASARELKPSDCWLEIGAESGDAAREKVREGEFFVAGVSAVDMGGRVAGAGIGQRAACAAVIAAAAPDPSGPGRPPVDVALAFTVQACIKPRGLRTAAFGSHAGLGVLVTAIPAGGKEDEGVRIGAGPVLVLKDSRGLTREESRARLENAAGAAGVSIQYAVLGSNGPDLGLATLAASGGGMGVAAVGLPVRFSGTPAEVVAVQDVAGAAAWLHTLIRS